MNFTVAAFLKRTRMHPERLCMMRDIKDYIYRPSPHRLRRIEMWAMRLAVIHQRNGQHHYAHSYLQLAAKAHQ